MAKRLVTDAERDEIIKCIKDGLTDTLICKKLGFCTKQTVRYYRRRYVDANQSEGKKCVSCLYGDANGNCCYYLITGKRRGCVADLKDGCELFLFGDGNHMTSDVDESWYTNQNKFKLRDLNTQAIDREFTEII